MFFGGSLPVTSTGISSYLSKLIPALMVEKIDCSSSGGGGGMYTSRGRESARGRQELVGGQYFET